MEMYKIPIMLIIAFVLLLVVNVIYTAKDYKHNIQHEDCKVALYPNIITLILILAGIILSLYYCFIIYKQLH